MFNSYSMTQMVASITNAMGVAAPLKADKSIPLVDAFVEKTLGGKKVDRVLIYNPDCVGLWHYQKYTDMFIPVLVNTQLTVPMATVCPTWTPVCFGSMYTGVSPTVHGILKYEKPVLKVDSFYDALPRAGKKVANVAVEHSSMAMIYQNRPIDYFIEKYDKEATEKALQLIQEDKYDAITVYNQEYDDMIHLTTPESVAAINAIKHHVESFVKLVEAVQKYWKDHNTLIVFAPDHGNHYDWDGHGNHGEFREDDVNINHYYSIVKKQ
ncbi:MAG: hypothetical protein HUK23_02190 [Sphaerochaetaceae bacterium]|nr:hypothetical protein [Sphaerochaetaceae bacterium]